MKKRGNVYFIQRGSSGPIKIGVTIGGPLNRLAELQTASPETLYLIGCIRGEEVEVHDRFNAHRIIGEWFTPHEDILKFIRLNDAPPLRARGGEIKISFRLSDELRAEVELERQRIRAEVGTEVKTSFVIRSILQQELGFDDDDIEPDEVATNA